MEGCPARTDITGCGGVLPNNAVSRLLGFTSNFDPLPVPKTNSSVVKVPSDAALTSEPVNPKDEPIEIWSDQNL